MAQIKTKKIVDAKGNIRKSHVIKSVCVGGKLDNNYSPKNYVEVKASIDNWSASTKVKSILRMRGEYTIENWQWIFWN